MSVRVETKQVLKQQSEGKKKYLISEAAKILQLEPHVLRYWEEELELKIQRNQLGQRFYTEVEMEQFRWIKRWKEEGMQLRGIRSALKRGGAGEGKTPAKLPDHLMENSNVIAICEDELLEKEQKAKRLQYLLTQMMREAVKENNDILLKEVRDLVSQEIGEQFQKKEALDRAREEERMKREEEHFKRIDEMLRVRSEKSTERKKKWATLGASH